jgi:predicted Zn-dependent protease
MDITVSRALGGDFGHVALNQVDDVSLSAAVRAAERDARLQFPILESLEALPPAFQYPTTAIWSDATHRATVEDRERVARGLVEPAEAAGMLSAGYLNVGASGIAQTGPDGTLFYARRTQAQCSMTVRDPQGTGSGWAGLSSYDWSGIDHQALAARALQKCLASRNPVTLEPGRYTVILEPQAVHELVSLLVQSLDRDYAERQGGPFAAGVDNALGLGLTKLGLKVVDERITIGHDPGDPAQGVVPFFIGAGGAIEPVRAVSWIDRGVLTTLAYERNIYALPRLGENQGFPNTGAYRMSGGTTSVEEMIGTTKRGLLVTRFSNVQMIDPGSLLATGLTRDGLWLIEDGKIAKAVKNFRFTESPLFVLNSLEQLGEPVPVFNPGGPAIVPPLKARDFSFTSLIDAV